MDARPPSLLLGMGAWLKAAYLLLYGCLLEGCGGFDFSYVSPKFSACCDKNHARAMVFFCEDSRFLSDAFEVCFPTTNSINSYLLLKVVLLLVKWKHILRLQGAAARRGKGNWCAAGAFRVQIR